MPSYKSGAGVTVYLDTDPSDAGPAFAFLGGMFSGTDYGLVRTEGWTIGDNPRVVRAIVPMHAPHRPPRHPRAWLPLLLLSQAAVAWLWWRWGWPVGLPAMLATHAIAWWGVLAPNAPLYGPVLSRLPAAGPPKKSYRAPLSCFNWAGWPPILS